MSDEAQPPREETESDELGPPKQVLGTFGRAYRLTKSTRRYLMVIEGVFVVSLIPCLIAVFFRDPSWWKWSLVAAASLLLRSVVIKATLVFSGIEGIDVPLSERRRRYARQIDANGVVETLWVVPVCFALLVALVAYDMLTGPKSLRQDLWGEAGLVAAFALSLWLVLTVRRFIRKLANQ